MTALLYPIAAVLEIAGCFAVWSWWRGGAQFCDLWRGVYRGLARLAVAGGGMRSDRVDLAGATLALIGAAVILLVPGG